MVNPEHIMSSPEATKLLKDKDMVQKLVQSSDAQALMSMLNQTSGGGLKSAAQSAMMGDLSQIQSMLQQVVSSPDGAKLISRLNDTAQGK